jgi:hypothetical protein
MALDPLEERCIELYALYGTPQSIFKDMKREFGENSLSAGQIRKLRETKRKQIVERRKVLCAKIPILDPQERWAYLQQIVDGALEGDEVFGKDGIIVGYKIDRGTALNALKLAQDITTPTETINTENDDLIRSIVAEAFDDIKKNNPTLGDKELLNRMLEELPDTAKPYIEEIRLEAVA